RPHWVVVHERGARSSTPLRRRNVDPAGISKWNAGLAGDVELPEVGQDLDVDGEMAVVESVKAASDVYAPISGNVLAVNEALADVPETINTDPYGEGWIVRLQPAGEIDESSMMSPDDYQTLLDELDEVDEVDD
ncbi:MAG: hypothetical protein IID59_01370, partial [Proteobacteria bacterium]|nr:hypothetical protein [Pseudomonadota bacterium]